MNADQSQGPAPVQQSKMVTEFEFKKIIQDLRDPQKFDQGVVKLDKFMKTNPQYDSMKNLQKESDFFAKKVLNSLDQHRNGGSWKSTSNSDSIGG